MPQSIDMTPTWVELTPTLLTIFADGDAKGRAFAQAELLRMARLADCASVLTGAHRRPDAPFPAPMPDLIEAASLFLETTAKMEGENL